MLRLPRRPTGARVVAVVVAVVVVVVVVVVVAVVVVPARSTLASSIARPPRVSR